MTSQTKTFFPSRWAMFAAVLAAIAVAGAGNGGGAYAFGFQSGGGFHGGGGIHGDSSGGFHTRNGRPGHFGAGQNRAHNGWRHGWGRHSGWGGWGPGWGSDMDVFPGAYYDAGCDYEIASYGYCPYPYEF